MKYTVISKDATIELNRLLKEPYSEELCFSHPSYFSHHMLGLTPFKYQHLILRKFKKGYQRKNDRIIICKSRQIGISYCLAILAVWYAITNQAASGPHKNTKVGIVSRDDDAAKDLMALIKEFVYSSPKGLDCMIKGGRRAPLNKREIHFTNGFIKCYPPTNAIRGKTFDLLIVDEAAFVDGEIFKKAAEPTVSAVDGKIILSSTPNGQKEFFFELFDPNDRYKEHSYERFWFYWEMCQNPVQKRIIEQEKKEAVKTGTMKTFKQEYEADFTVDEESFFETEDIMRAVDNNLIEEYEWKNSDCSIAIDYGMTLAGTSVTVVTKYEGKIKLLFQFSERGFDENLLMDSDYENSIPNLFKRYNVVHLVADDCPQGNRTNKQLENEGYPLNRFSFKSDAYMKEKNRASYLFRNALKHDIIKYYQIAELIAEMKTIQEIRMEKYMKIKAPKGYPDDRVDSLMMACYPFLEEEGDFKSVLVDYQQISDKIKKQRRHDGRFDEDWDKIVNSEVKK